MEMKTDDWGTGQKDIQENRRARFIRIGKSRMRRALNTARLIGNLATANYEYYPDDIAKMEKAVNEEYAKAFAKFKKIPKPKEKEVDFSFETRQ